MTTKTSVTTMTIMTTITTMIIMTAMRGVGAHLPYVSMTPRALEILFDLSNAKVFYEYQQ